jgi:hypothetical protein
LVLSQFNYGAGQTANQIGIDWEGGVRGVSIPGERRDVAIAREDVGLAKSRQVRLWKVSSVELCGFAAEGAASAGFCLRLSGAGCT